MGLLKFVVSIWNKQINIINNGKKYFSHYQQQLSSRCVNIDQIVNWESTSYTDTDEELLTGCPSLGNITVYAKFDTPISSTTKVLLKFKFDEVARKNRVTFWKTEYITFQFSENPIWTIWRTERSLETSTETKCDVYQKHIPTKKNTKHS